MSSTDKQPVRQASSLQRLLLQLCLVWLGSAVAQEAKPTGIDLTKATLNQTLAALSPDAYVLMEFYATWCPACR
jgi:thiol-disulfide isomerase/thioredoxin